MSLRTRTLLITGSVALILLLALSFSSRLAVLRGFEDVETEAALVDVRRVHSEIADVLEHIRSIGGDWGPWDDTYEFVAAASKTSTSATISATKPWPTSISTSWCSWAPTSGWYTSSTSRWSMVRALKRPCPGNGWRPFWRARTWSGGKPRRIIGSARSPWLEIGMDRRIYRQGLLTWRYNVISLLLLGVVFVVGLLLYLERTVLVRLGRVHGAVRAIAHSGDASQRVPPEGSDELGELAAGVNGMLATLEQAHARRVAAEARYRAIVDSQMEMICRTDGQGRLTFVNDAFARELGESVAALLGRPLESLPVVEIDGGLAQIRTALRRESQMTMENRLVLPGGERWQLWTHRAIRDDNGCLVEYQSVGRDITERRRAEIALRQNQDYQRALLDSIQCGVLVVEASSGRILDLNAAAAALVGLSRDKILGQVCNNVICPAEPDQSLAPDGGWALEMTEWRLIRADGSEMPILKSVASVEREGRHLLIESFIDLRPRKQMEADLRASERRYREFFEQDLTGDFISTPDGRILDCNIALARILGYDSVAAVKTVKLTAFYHRPEEYAQLLQDLKLLRPSLPASIETDAHLPRDADCVLADPTQLHQIVMNLCTNAAHAMRKTSGRLEIRLQREDVSASTERLRRHLSPGSYLKLTVADTGHGILPEMLDLIFDPYFTTKEKGEGTGMGLSVVQGIVHSYRGAVLVDSLPGAGSTFHVYLPLAAEGPDVPLLDCQQPLPRGGERVMVVDDEPDVADVTGQRLTRWGYEVTICTDSREALERFRRNPGQFDLVVTDQTMPHLNGDLLGREMLRLRPDLPVIVCTGFSKTVCEETALAMGFRAFLAKPLFARALAQTVRRVLDQATPCPCGADACPAVDSQRLRPA